MPIRKAMGISMSSQKRKKRNMSRAKKTPMTPTSSNSNITKNSFTRCWMLLHEARTEMGVRNVVNSTRNMLMPSAPR